MLDINSVKFQLLTRDKDNGSLIALSDKVSNENKKAIDVSLYNRLHNCSKAGNNCYSYLALIFTNEKRYSPAVKRLLAIL